jgi:hypothetical protein
MNGGTMDGGMDGCAIGGWMGVCNRWWVCDGWMGTCWMCDGSMDAWMDVQWMVGACDG